MKHTECKKCKLRVGDCGNHFKMDGITDYDIPSQSACDQYDNCMFFQPEPQTHGNVLVSREALKLEFSKHEDRRGYLIGDWEDIIDSVDAPRLCQTPLMKIVLAMAVAIVRLTIIEKRYLIMKIVNYEKMKRHFEHVVDVKIFTVPNILTIMETFTEDLPDAVARDDIRSGKLLSTEDLQAAQRGSGKTMATIYMTGWNDALEAAADNGPSVFRYSEV